jgi:hypothetical protein
LTFAIAPEIAQCSLGIEFAIASGNDKYQIANGKWKMGLFVRFAI